jgi:hypothetical protein
MHLPQFRLSANSVCQLLNCLNRFHNKRLVSGLEINPVRIFTLVKLIRLLLDDVVVKAKYAQYFALGVDIS